MHVRAIVTLLLVTALVVPAAAAWSGKGAREPSTQLDRTGGFMWNTSDVTRAALGTRLFFNAFTVQNTGYVTHGFSDNPNLGTLGTARQAWPGNVAALLGVWKDCNKDGFVGNGDNALFEYRSELLTDTSVCPLTTLPPVPAGPASFNYKPVHNDGKWVMEFIPLGPDAANAITRDANPFDLNDNGARVWADWNKLGDMPPDTKCFLVFAPPGTYRSTGGLLNTLDCFTGFLVTDTWNSVAPDNTPAGTLSFRDKPRDQGHSASRLNQQNPWGDPAGASMVTVLDCTRPPVFTTPVPGTAYRVSVYNPRVPSTNTGGSLGGTVNETENALEDCNRTQPTGNPHFAGTPYAQEYPGVRNYEAKVQNDFPMGYSEGVRPPNPIFGLLGPSTANDAGTRAVDSTGLWLSETRIAEDRNPFVDRANVASPFHRVTYISAYGFVSGGAVTTYGLQLSPAGGTGVYGSANCVNGIGAGKGVQRGWECDPGRWITDCSNGYQCAGTINGMANVDISVDVGQVYNLRDIDCYDESVDAARAAGVGWGLLTGSSCV